MNQHLYLLLCTAYRTLCHSQFEGRHSVEGQELLCCLRDEIAKFTGQDPKEVQDWAEA